MNINTGQYVDLHEHVDFADPTGFFKQQLRAADQLDCAVDDVVLVEGTRDQVEALSRRVRLGAGEDERRRVRRRQQKASRRANRRG